MHFRPPGRSAHRIVPHQLELTLGEAMYHLDYTLAHQWHDERLRAAARRRLVAEPRKAGKEERAPRGPLPVRSLTRWLPKRTVA